MSSKRPPVARSVSNSRSYTALRRVGLFGVGVIGLMLTLTLGLSRPAEAAAGINKTLNFQGRLLTNTGAVVADGNYNMRFKIYQDGAGTAAGNPGGTLMWTELWQNNVGTGSSAPVVVKNGYFSVNLATHCAFSGGSCQGNSNTSIDFNQDTLWLSMDVAGTSTSTTPTYDGELLPMRRLASAVYALQAQNSNSLGGLTSSQYLQLAQGVQADSSTSNASIFVNKTGATADIIDLQRGGADVMLINNSGQSLFRPTVDSQTALQVQKAGTTTVAFTVDTSNSRIGIGLGNPSYAVDAVGSVNASVSVKIAGTDVCTSSGCTANPASAIQNLNAAGAGSPQSGNIFLANGGANGDATVVIKMTATQTGNPLQIRNSSDNVIAKIDASGNLAFAGGLNSVDKTSGTTGNLTIRSGNNTGGASGDVQIDVGTATTTVGGLKIGTGANGAATAAITMGNASNTLTVNAGTTSIASTANINASANNATNINTGTSTGAVTIGNSAAGAITLQSASTVGLTGTTSITGLSAGTGTALTVNNFTSTGSIFVAQDNGSAVFTVANGGATTLKNQTNSTAAFQIQNSSSASLLSVNTSDNMISLLGNNSGETAAWAATTALPQARQYSTSVSHNGYVYVISGYDGASGTNTIVYAKVNNDGTLGSWTTNANNLPAVRLAASAVVGNNGYLYVLGGTDGVSSATSTVYYAKFNTDGSIAPFTTSGISLPAARFNAGATVYNGYLYHMGGNGTYGSNATADTIYYTKLNANGSFGSFTTNSEALADGRAAYSLVVANGYFYTVGATAGSGYGTNWIQYGKFLADGSVDFIGSAGYTPFVAHTGSGFVANGYLYVAGGDTNDEVYYMKILSNGTLDDPITAPTAKKLPAVRHEAAQAQVGNYLYVLGGYNGSASQNTAYYTTVPRVTIGGGLDLVSGTSTEYSEGRSGGALTAGNTSIVGTLSVQDSANFIRDVFVGGKLMVQDVALDAGKSLTVNSGATALTGLAAGSSTALSVTSGATTNLGLLVQGVASQSADIMQVKANGVSNPLLSVAANGRVGIGVATASYPLDVVGDINSSTGFRAGGSAGITSTCLGTWVSQGQIVKGGIITSENCKANTLQNAYDNGGGLPVKIQEVNNTNTASPYNTTVSATNTGNLLIAVIGVNAGSSQSVTSVTDNASNTWVLAGAGFQSGTNNRVEIWYAKNATSTTSVTTTLSSGSVASTTKILEYSNMDTNSPLDAVVAQGNASSTTAGTGTLNTTNTTDLIIAGMSYSSVTTTSTAPGGAWTNYTDQSVSSTKQTRAVSRLVAATGAYSTSWTLSSAELSGTVIVGFKTSGSITSSADINLANSKDLIINAADTATDSSMVINLQCTTCSSNGGRFAVQNAGTDVLTVSPNSGGIALVGATTATGKAAGSSTALTVATGATTNIGLTVKAAASQSADLLQFQDPNGAILGKTSASGALTTYGTTTSITGLATPAFTTASTGSAYYYAITATNAAGETMYGTGLGMANNTSTLDWTQVSGATGYKIYRNTTNSFSSGSRLLTTITNGTTVSYTDTGSATGAGLPPTSVTGTKLYVSAWAGQNSNQVLQVQNGNASDIFSITAEGATAIRLQNDAAVGLYVRGKSLTQTADLLQFQDSNALVNGSINALGNQLTLGRIAASGTVTQGKLVLSDGTTDNFGLTLQSATLTGNRTITLPNATGTVALLQSNQTFSGVNNFTNYTAIGAASTSNYNLEVTGTSLFGQQDTGGALVVKGNGWTAFEVNTATSTTNIGTNVILGSAATDTLTLNGTIQGTNALVFEGSVPDAFETTLQVTNPTASRTITLPNETGTVCTTGSVCTGYAPSATNGYVALAPAAAQADTTTNSSIFIDKQNATGNLLQLQRSASDVFVVTNSGSLLVGGGTGYGFTLNNKSMGVTGSTANSSIISIGATTTNAGTNLYVLQDSGKFDLTGAATTVSNIYGADYQADITVASGTYNVTNAYGARYALNNTAGETITSRSALNVSYGTNNGTVTNDYGLKVTEGATTGITNKYGIYVDALSGGATATYPLYLKSSAAGELLSVNSTGATLFKNSTDSSAAFQIQNAAGVNEINVNNLTTNANLWPNPSFEVNINGVMQHGSAVTISHDGYDVPAKYGSATLKVVTATTVNNGAEFRYPFKASTTYSVSFWMRKDSGSSAYINVGRADNGSDTDCLTSQTANTTWTQLSCSFTTGTTIGSTSNFYIKNNTTNVMTFYIDGVTLVEGASALSYSLPGSSLEVMPYTNNLTINAGASGELQPWQLNPNPISNTAGTTQDRSRAGVTTANGYIYVLGGGTGVDGASIVTTNTVLYAKIYSDGTLGSWKNNANNLNTNVAGGAATVVNGYIYLIGGTTGSDSAVVQYARLNADGSTGTWSTTTTLTQVRDAPAVTTYNGYIQVYGGNSGSSTLDTTLYGKVNPNGTISGWSAGTTMAYQRESFQAVVSNGYVYAVAGSNSNGGGTEFYVECAPLNLDGSIGTWNIAGSIPANRGDIAVAAINNTIYAIGGWDGAASAVKTVYYAKAEDDGSTMSWQTSAYPLPIGNSVSQLAGVENARAVAVNGYIYVIGGDDTNTANSKIYYTSGPRLQVIGSLDLTSGGRSLNEPTSGGELTAGNTSVVGQLNVAGTASFLNNVNITGQLIVGGDVNFRSFTNSAAAFQVQNQAGASLLKVDTTSTALVVGTGDGGTPAAMTIRGAAATGTNVRGADITIDASNGTGTGGSGALIFKTADSSAGTAVTKDAVASAEVASNTVISWSHTTASQSNRLLIVSIASQRASSPASTVSGNVTYNGVAMTKLTAQVGPSSNGYVNNELWYMIAPPVGTFTVSATVTSTSALAGGSITLYNVDQTTPMPTFNSNSGSTSNPSITLSGTTSSQLIINTIANETNSTSAGSGQTLQWSRNANTAGSFGETVASSGLSTTTNWTTSAQNWAQITAAVNAVGGSTANTLAEALRINQNGHLGLGSSATPYDLTFGAIAGVTTAKYIGVDLQPTAATGGNGLMVTAGAGNTSGIGGTLTLQGGTGGSTGVGGTATLQGGTGGSSSGNGGAVTILGGTPINGAGGSITITAGSGVGTNKDGGNVTINVGARTGSGIKGTFTVNNDAGDSLLRVDPTTQSTLFGKASTRAGILTLQNAINANTATLQSGVTSSSYTLTLPTALGSSGDCLKDTSGAGALGFGACGSSVTLQGSYDADTDSGDTIIALTAADDSLIFRNPASGGTNGTGYILTLDQLATDTTGGLDIQSAGTGNLLRVRDTTATAADVFTIADGGGAIFKNQTNSTSALQVQNAAGTNLLTADTTNSRLYVGPTAGDTVGALLVLGNKTDSGDPTGVNGAMYYNSNIHQFRCYRDSNWEACGSSPIDRGFELTEEFMGGASASDGAIGQLGWADEYITGSTTSDTIVYNQGGVLPTADHPGILRLYTNDASPVTNNGISVLLADSNSRPSWALAAGNVVKTTAAVGSASANTQVLRIGIHNQTTGTAAPTTGVWWEADPDGSANWQYCYTNGTPTATCAASGTAIAANTLVRLEIRINALGSGTSSVTFIINGTSTTVSSVTVNTTNLVNPAISCYAKPASAQSCYVDYYQIRGISSAAR